MILPRRLQFTRVRVPHSELSSAPFLLGRDAALLVIALGTPVVAVILFELLLFVSSAFNHSNLKLPLWLDKKLRWIIATPDVHRIHHSVIVDEQNTNYGFFIIWWDKLFSTFTSQPTAGHHGMSIGLKDDDNGFDRVTKMLLGPFR